MKRTSAIVAAAALTLLSQATFAGNAPQKSSRPADSVERSTAPAAGASDAKAEAENLCREKNLAGSAYEECVKLELARRAEKEPAADAPNGK